MNKIWLLRAVNLAYLLVDRRRNGS